MTDIVEQAARVIYDTENYNRAVLEDAQVIAQALADAGLLAEPSLTVPHRDEVAAAIAQGYEPENPTPNRHDYRAADAVLELMADQPTVTEVKAEALEDLAREANDNTELDKTDRHLISNWCIVAAQQHRAGE